jgi:hypothetical protein
MNVNSSAWVACQWSGGMADMAMIEFEPGAVQVDARLVAGSFGISPESFMDLLRAGKIAARHEVGIDADAGRQRLTFIYASRQLQVVIDDSGSVLERTLMDYTPGNNRQ